MIYNKNDIMVLDVLQYNARLSAGKIGRKIRLSPQTVINRIKYLESKGIIKKYSVFIDWRKLGYQTYELWLTGIPKTGENCVKKIHNIIESIPEIKYFKYASGSEQFVFGVTAKDEDAIFKVNEQIVFKLEEIISIKGIRLKEIISEYHSKNEISYL